MLDLLAKWEPVWLLLILLVEMIAGLYSAYVLRIEYLYDKEWNERKVARRKRAFQFEQLNEGEGK